MARQVSSDNYSPNRLKLEPSDLGEKPAILTVMNADELDIMDSSRPDGFRKALVLQFREVDGRALWPNATQSQTLIQMLGNDLDAWVDAPVPLEPKNVRFGGNTYYKVCVPEAREWKEIFDSMGHKYPYKVFPAIKRGVEGKAVSKGVAKGNAKRR